MVNSVLANLPLYFFSIFKAPLWVTRRIDTLRRAFFWNGGSAVLGGHCLVQWKIVCRNRKDGGLGVLDLQAMNLALLSKWWWRFFSDTSSQWGRLVKCLYYSRRRLLWEGTSFRPFSQWWQGVLRTREIFKCGVSFQIGDGRAVSFWSERWAGSMYLSTMFPNIFEGVWNKKLKVRECAGRSRWKWEKILRWY